jgi:hypothetical protein
MTKALTKLLEYGFAGNAERSRLLNKESFKKDLEGTSCFFPDDKNPERIDGYKALLQSERNAINASTLVQEEVYKTVVEGSEPFKCWRECQPIIQTDSYSVRFVKGEEGTYAQAVAEGAKITIDTQEYTKTDITIDKYGVRPLITNELIEDGLFDVIDLELKKAGARMENKLNRVILKAVLAGITTNTLNPAGPHITVSDVAQGIGKIKKQNYLPDTLVLHPTAEAYLMQDSNLAYVAWAGGNEALRNYSIGTKLMGLTPYDCTATDAASPTWDDTTAGSDVTALVLSKNDLGATCMRRDLTVEQYDDPIHDLVGIALTMRYGYGVLREKAGCKIYHK